MNGSNGCHIIMNHKNGIKMSLSVVVVTYNRSEVLRQNLEEFKKQTDKDFEVIVAIDGSTDNTIEMLESNKWPFPVKWIDTEETGKYCLAKARNMGILEASGKSIVVLEDFTFDSPKTKSYSEIISNLGLVGKKTLLILADANKNVYLSSRNLQRTNVVTASELSTYSILNAGTVLLMEGAVEKIENILS